MGSSPRPRGSTRCGSEAPSCPRCPRSRRCGSKRRSTTRVGLASCTGNAPRLERDEEKGKIMMNDERDVNPLIYPVYFLILWRMDWVCDSNLAIFLFLHSSHVAFVDAYGVGLDMR